MGNNGKLFDMRISRPLDVDSARKMQAGGFVAVAAIVEDIARENAKMDREICEAVGFEAPDSGAGFGMRDLQWIALEWSVVEVAARRALELPIPGLQVSVTIHKVGTIQ